MNDLKIFVTYEKIEFRNTKLENKIYSAINPLILVYGHTYFEAMTLYYCL